MTAGLKSTTLRGPERLILVPPLSIPRLVSPYYEEKLLPKSNMM